MTPASEHPVAALVDALARGDHAAADRLAPDPGPHPDAPAGVGDPAAVALAAAQLRAEGKHDAADALVEAAGHAAKSVKKADAMNTLALSAGGALVRPPGPRRRKRKVRRAAATILKGL